MAVTVRIEVDEHVRDKAARNLADCGLTIGEAMRIVLVQAAAGRDLDLGPLAPNRTTMDAINAARGGNSWTWEALQQRSPNSTNRARLVRKWHFLRRLCPIRYIPIDVGTRLPYKCIDDGS